MSARQLVLEPPQALEYVVNLIRSRRRFVVEVGDDAMRDVVCIAVEGMFQRRPETHVYVEGMTCTTLDDACQFAVNNLKDGVCFSVEPTNIKFNDGKVVWCEWVFTAERKRRRGLGA